MPVGNLDPIDVVTDDQNDSVQDVAADDGALTGIVSLDDLVAPIDEQLEEVSDRIEAQSPEHSP